MENLWIAIWVFYIYVCVCVCVFMESVDLGSWFESWVLVISLSCVTLGKLLDPSEPSSHVLSIPTAHLKKWGLNQPMNIKSQNNTKPL
jgi:hypothetical protein